MKGVINYAPPNSLILIHGSSNADIPNSMDGKGISATPSCIAVGTLSQQDGETSIVLTDEISALTADEALHIVYTGQLETPNREILVENVLGDLILKMPTKEKHTKISVFSNHDSEPDKLVIIIQ